MHGVPLIDTYWLPIIITFSKTLPAEGVAYLLYFSLSAQIQPRYSIPGSYGDLIFYPTIQILNRRGDLLSLSLYLSLYSRVARRCAFAGASPHERGN